VPRRCCTGRRTAQCWPDPDGGCTRRTEKGLAARIMRLSTATAMATSPCWPGSERARRFGPISCWCRPIVVSTWLRLPSPVVRGQPMRPFSAIGWICPSRGLRAAGLFVPGTADARRDGDGRWWIRSAGPRRPSRRARCRRRHQPSRGLCRPVPRRAAPVPGQHHRRCPPSAHAGRSRRCGQRRPDAASAIADALIRASQRSIHVGRTAAIQCCPACGEWRRLAGWQRGGPAKPRPRRESVV
jgi:hypothetical protein